MVLTTKQKANRLLSGMNTAVAEYFSQDREIEQHKGNYLVAYEAQLVINRDAEKTKFYKLVNTLKVLLSDVEDTSFTDQELIDLGIYPPDA